MKILNGIGKIIVLIVAISVFCPSISFAWGPGTHFYLADQILRLGLLTGSAGVIARDHKILFYYGSIVADVVIGKGFISYENHSHNWDLARDLRNRASTEDEEAFALGIWTHLAADTVAHNDFVPSKTREVRLPGKLAHAYWEFRAERWIPEEYWNQLEHVISHDFAPHEELLEDTIRATVAPFTVNWAVMKSVLKISTWQSWRRLGDFYTKLSSHDLNDDEMEPYMEICLERMAQSLSDDESQDLVLNLDPTGDFPEYHIEAPREVPGSPDT